MLSDIEHFQIFDPVIVLDAVDVMNVFCRKQRASKMLLHDIAVLRNPSAID